MSKHFGASPAASFLHEPREPGLSTKEVSSNLRGSKASILLLADVSPKWRLVFVLVLLSVMPISAPAQSKADPHDSSAEPVSHATVSVSSRKNATRDEYADLKFSGSVRELAHLARLSPETTFHLCWDFNFFLLVALTVWKLGPLLKAAFSERSKSIRRAIDEAQHLSENARKRLAEVERRWAQIDSEIAAIQARAETQMQNEEQVLTARMTEDIRRIMEYASFEIDRAAQRARDELKAFAAALAVSVARQSIRVDERTDQGLVKGFIEGMKRYETAQTSSQPPAKV